MRFYLSLLTVFVLVTSCYPTSISFKDNSMDPELKTFTVINFEQSAPNAPVNYPISFTEFLKDGILGNTKLKLDQSGTSSAHLIFSGVVTDYSISPVSIQGDSQAALTRLTISMRIEVENTLKPEKSFTVNPRRFADFDSNQDLNSVESQLLEDINQQILQDILNKLQSDW
ncbi:hypothetical protein GCM10009118_09110 [Wandonia haliotis]|uniref:Lipopolysaccharide-assembly n=1 Tax=Wandonia haliotis TaxID=574963 RepID=A0ABN1MMK8_9FLAO